MLRVIMILGLAVLPATVSYATSDEIKRFLRDYDCVSYRLTDTRQRGKMSGETPVWLVINEGPTNVVVRENNRKPSEFGVFDGENVSIVAGDKRYEYTIGLSKNGSALVHICQ